MAMAGKATVVQVSPTAGGAGVYTEVDDLNNATINFDGANLDVTKFTLSFIRRIQGLKDASYALSGFRKPSDTNGQNAIISAWLNDTTLWVKILPDGTNGWKQEVKVASISVPSDVSGTVDFSADLEGTDTIAAVP